MGSAPSKATVAAAEAAEAERVELEQTIEAMASQLEAERERSKRLETEVKHVNQGLLQKLTAVETQARRAPTPPARPTAAQPASLLSSPC